MTVFNGGRRWSGRSDVERYCYMESKTGICCASTRRKQRMAHIDRLGDPNHSSLNLDKDVFLPNMWISHIFSPFLCEIPIFSTHHKAQWGRIAIHNFCQISFDLQQWEILHLNMRETRIEFSVNPNFNEAFPLAIYTVSPQIYCFSPDIQSVYPPEI